MDRDKILQQVRAMLEKRADKGATESEAIAAAEMASKLMEKYGLTQADVDSIHESSGLKFGEVPNRTKNIHPVMKWCSTTVASFCRCTTYWNPPKGDSRGKITYFGEAHEIELAVYLTEFLVAASDRSWKDYLKSEDRKKGVSGHKAFWSFQAGFTRGVNAKMRQIIEERDAQVPKDDTGTSLVIVKEGELKKRLEEEFGIKLSKSKKRGFNSDSGTILAGYAEGQKVNLDSPISGGRESRTAIG